MDGVILCPGDKSCVYGIEHNPLDAAYSAAQEHKVIERSMADYLKIKFNLLDFKIHRQKSGVTLMV
jgi:hypothetical protein